MYDNHCSFFPLPVLPNTCNTPWGRDLNKQNILFPKMLFRQRNRIYNVFYIFQPPVWSHPNTGNHNLYDLISTLPKDKTTQLTILFSGMVFEEIFNFSLYLYSNVKCYTLLWPISTPGTMISTNLNLHYPRMLAYKC